MKTHTSTYKNKIKLLGREINSKITYLSNGVVVELGMEDLNSITPHYEGEILKSVMKQLDIESTVDIPVGTQIIYQFGLKVDEVEIAGVLTPIYEWMNFGNYIVFSSEKQEDTRSWKIVAYDKMLYAMKDYENVYYQFPMTIRDYIGEICTTLGLTFANSSDTFANYDKILTQDMFLDANGAFLGYTFRDVLDQLSEVTASTICINGSDQLEVRYITDTSDTIDEEYLKDINVNFGEKYGPVNSIVLSRSAGADNVYLRDDQSITLNGLCEIKISDNQIMNGNDRSDYLTDILTQLDGLEYYINDFSSTGITYYELCDKYNISVDNNTYQCVMFNDEINVTQGIEELIHTDMPEQGETDYTKADKTDRKINQAYAIVDKQNNTITNFVSQVTEQQELNDERILELTQRTNSVEQTLTSTQATIEVMQQEIINGQETLHNNLVTIDINGINVSTNLSAISTLITNEKFIIKSGETTLAFFGYDETIGATKAEMDNLTVTNYFIAGYHRTEKIPSEQRTGVFYIGA